MRLVLDQGQQPQGVPLLGIASAPRLDAQVHLIQAHHAHRQACCARRQEAAAHCPEQVDSAPYFTNRLLPFAAAGKYLFAKGLRAISRQLLAEQREAVNHRVGCHRRSASSLPAKESPAERVVEQRTRWAFVGPYGLPSASIQYCTWPTH